MKTEEKAKVVSAVWGAEFIQFLDALAILKNSNRFRQNILLRFKELNKFFPLNISDDLRLFFCLYPSSMVGPMSLADVGSIPSAIVYCLQFTFHIINLSFVVQ